MSAAALDVAARGQVRAQRTPGMGGSAEDPTTSVPQLLGVVGSLSMSGEEKKPYSIGMPQR